MTTPIVVGNAATPASPISGLADAIDSILDKGLVIDAFVRVSVIGIDLVTIEARIVLASVDTYLQFAQAITQLTAPTQAHTTPLLESQRQARHQTEGPVGPTALGAAPGNGETAGPAPSSPAK
jgi:hypothetical protein